MTKFYPWADLGMNTVDVEGLIGKRIEANRHYAVSPRRFPAAFQDRLAKDGFDLSRDVTLEAMISAGGFGIRVDQE